MSKKFLGLAVGSRSILAAEVSCDEKSAGLMKSAEYPFDEADSMQQPAELGKKFGEFLKLNGFTARLACAGLPTQWLMLKEKTLPAVADADLAGILLLQAERDFSLEPKDLALDYCEGAREPSGPRHILLVATLRERIGQLEAVAKAAGLTLRAALPVSVALAAAAQSGTLLSAGASGADLIVETSARLYVPTVLSTAKPEGAAWAAQAGQEARRSLALRAGVNADAPVALWNGAGLDQAALQALASGIGATLRIVNTFKTMNVNGLANAPRFAPAVAAALAGRAPALNFLNSKLAEKKPSTFARVKPWMAAAALFGIVSAGALAYAYYRDYSEFNDLKKATEARKAEVDAAKTFLARYASAQGWYDKRPNHLDCMKELERAIPHGGSAWIANLTVKEDFHCVAAMKAVDTKNYFEVFDAIEKNDMFRDVKLVYMTQPDKKKSEISFAIGFVFWKQ